MREDCHCHVRTTYPVEDAYIKAIARVMAMAKAEKDGGTWESRQFADAVLTAIDEEFFD